MSFLGFKNRQLGTYTQGAVKKIALVSPGKPHRVPHHIGTSKPLSAITNAAPFRAEVIGKLIKKWETEEATAAVVELQMPDTSIFSVGQTKATPIEIEFLSTLEVGHE